MNNDVKVLIDFLTQLKEDEVNGRAVRAIAAAQVLSYKVYLDSSTNLSETLDNNKAQFRQTLYSVNERLIVDVDLAWRIFQELVTFRYKLITDPTNTTLLKALMSDESMDFVGEKYSALINNIGMDRKNAAQIQTTFNQLSNVFESSQQVPVGGATDIEDESDEGDVQ